MNLLVVQGQPAGKVLSFAPGEYFLGRGPECHLRFNSDWVSRQHCQLRVDVDCIYLRDLGSRNGTLVNGRLITTEERLAVGDQIQIGPLVFEVRAPAGPGAGEGFEPPAEEPRQGPTEEYPAFEPPSPG